MDSKEPLLQLNAIIDFVSPLCYEAVMNVSEAIESTQASIAVDFHPYFLVEDDLREMQERPDFAKISKAALSKASMNAHRLLLLVKQRDQLEAYKYVLAVMKAYHVEGRDISSVEELISISTNITSLGASQLKTFLEDESAATADVLEEAEENTGPSGAPFFIFGRKGETKRKIIFSGVQDVATLSDAIKTLSL